MNLYSFEVSCIGCKKNTISNQKKYEIMMTPSTKTIKKYSIKRNQRIGDKGKVTSLLSFTQMRKSPNKNA